MDIETHPAYIEGHAARLSDQGRDICPYGDRRLMLKSIWLAGWHDADMEA